MAERDLPRTVFFTTLAALALLGAFLYGLFAAHRENAVYQAVFGAYSQVKTLRDELPNIRKTYPKHFLRTARYDGEGITVNAFPEDDQALVLLSGFLGDNNGVRLMRRDGTVVASWTVSASALFPDRSFCRNPPMTDWNAIPHGTLAWPDGSIVFSFESCGMVRMDRCGNVLWDAAPDITHHSPTIAENGDIIISGGSRVIRGRDERVWPYSLDYWEDWIYRYTPDGERIMAVPLTELFLENDLGAMLTATGLHYTEVNGEFHLNEVSELSTELAPDFPMFEAGDLMLSIRNRNLLVITDAAGQRIKWWKIGPWLRQHDPDFQPGGTITVFDNHSDASEDGSRKGGSRIIELDPRTDTTRVLYGGTPDQHFYTRERGTHQMQPGGGILINEAQSGRVFEVDAEGEIVWEYVNRWDADRTMWMHDAAVYPDGYFTVSDWSCPPADQG